MMFKTQLVLAMHPDLKLRAKVASMSFGIDGEGSFGLTTGPIDARFDEIPISITIPFRRRHGRVIAASIGPFCVHLKPIEAHVRAFDVKIDGVLGKEGMECDLHAVGACKTEVEASGEFPTKRTKAMEGTAEE